ncbi:MAG: hypothetical protein KKA73_02970 [Chloroflexi bacterium]|nr:hypothetical protein [Chloroflexota bacterium]MBU1746626.1 hypothetical protein [Chloroflexota bacterium]
MEYVIAVCAILIGFLGTVLVAVWLGLRVKPRPFPPYAAPSPAPQWVDLPPGLPAPVSRFYQAIVGERIPLVETAIVTGRAQLRFMGVTLPGRFRFTYEAGQGYRHYIEATIWGYPLLKVNEHYLDHKSRLELPFGVVENEPKVDAAANLGLWGESMWLPSIFVTDPRVRWEPIDDASARLTVPFGEAEDTFTVTFDPATGLIRTMEALRWKAAASAEKTPWCLDTLGWQTFQGTQIPSPATVTWEDEGTPWAVFTIEDVTYNVDVSEYIKARGL